MATKYKYAGYPFARVYPTASRSKKNIHELLWGDWVRITGAKSNNFYPVNVRGVVGFVHKNNLQDERLLEVVFVDVGQGDGALLVTPKDKHMVIDAGESDNMHRFLKWRYGGFKKKWKFEAGIITHPDKDHYYGFNKLFDESNVSFESLFHNGIIETSKSGKNNELGKSRNFNGELYIKELMETDHQMRAFLKNKPRYTTAKGGTKLYAGMLRKAVDNKCVKKFGMLSSTYNNDGYLQGYESDKDFSIKVLGPVLEQDNSGVNVLRWFRKFNKGSVNKGQTKNGHSVLLKLQYKKVKILMSGDLNWAAEKFLLESHVGRSIPSDAATQDEKIAFTALAREVFGSDVAKSCHHGSADFMNNFLSACDSHATVVSSGDDESHAHPRSDTLGAIGRYGRGKRPLIFSTELARSTRENESPELVKKLNKKQKKLVTATKPSVRVSLGKEIKKLTDEIAERNVVIYGAINLRTDGEKIVMAQKLEKDRSLGSVLQKWDIYKIEQKNGRFEHVGSVH